MAGYSSTPLAKKLGIKAGNALLLVNAPAYYYSLFADMPGGVHDALPNEQVPFVHIFFTGAAGLSEALLALKSRLTPSGMIWASWPKKASGIVTDVSESLIRDTALSIGLVDVKVCAVDDTWSGLKLVIPVKDRK